MPYTKIEWDKSGEHFYETGVDHGVLYLVNEESNEYDTGVAWNGLTSVTESPSGGEATDLYADNIKYLSMISAEQLGLTIEAYTYPDEFGECDGSSTPTKGVHVGQQNRKTFGLSYRTIIGNDIKGDQLGYKLHLVYGCKAQPSERAYSTVNDSPEAATFSWTVNTTPVNVTDMKPTSLITIDSNKVSVEKLEALEKLLYGDGETNNPKLPLPDEVINTLKEE